MKQAIIDVEKALDEKFNKLSIWELPFQSIISSLFFLAEELDNRHKGQAVEFISNLSLIYNKIKERTNNHTVLSTSESLNLVFEKCKDDLNFIATYAGFASIMPDVHRGVLQVKKIDNDKFYLDYPDDETRKAEIIDRLYAGISRHVICSYPQEHDLLKEYTNKLAANNDNILYEADSELIESIYDFYKTYHLNIHVLPENILNTQLGFTYDEYYRFVASIQAYATFWKCLARSYNSLLNTPEYSFKHQEYREWSACSLDHSTIMHTFIKTSQLEKDKFHKILSYYIDIIADKTKETYIQNGKFGDGFFPPFILLGKVLIFSPHYLISSLNINNTLYSLNWSNPKLFNDSISQYLEPSLIEQTEYILKHLQNIRIQKNIQYTEGEIDMLVLSEKESVCLIIQVKATLASDSGRTVQRTQDRVLEATEQIERFDKIPSNIKLKLINDHFRTSFSSLKFINLILVRSSAGSKLAWKMNNKIKIINYALLSSLVADKIESNNLTISNIESEIVIKQKELVSSEYFSLTKDDLAIDKFKFEIPNVYFNQAVARYNLKANYIFPNFRKIK